MFFKPAEKKFGNKPAPAPVATDNGDINHLIRNLIITVTALRDVLVRENDALDRTKTADFLEIQDEKVTIARRYEMLMTSLLNRKDVATADAVLKNQLLSLEEGFSKVMKDNMVKLERMKGATEKLGDRIMKSARKAAESQTQFAYGAAGTMQKGNKASIGVNERA